MKKNYRENRKKGVIILRGTKYLFIVTVILFVVVFVLTRFTKPADDKTAEVSETASETTIVTTETTAEEDNVDIDNQWAMFLVNNENPLPDNYDSMIKTKLVHTSWREYYMDDRMADYMINMIAAAAKDGINLEVVSAYRTIEYQQQNFDNSVQQRMDNGMTYDEAYADTAKEVAFPGKSEHNAGLSADIMSDEYTSMDDDGFKNTKAYEWLSQHAAEYGFILRYPEGKEAETGIIYEPWHYRFVGIYYANEIKNSGLCLEEYFESKGWLDENGKAIKMTGPIEEPAETTVTAAPAETAPTEPQSEQQVSIIV